MTDIKDKNTLPAPAAVDLKPLIQFEPKGNEPLRNVIIGVFELPCEKANKEPYIRELNMPKDESVPYYDLNVVDWKRLQQLYERLRDQVQQFATLHIQKMMIEYASDVGMMTPDGKRITSFGLLKQACHSGSEHHFGLMRDAIHMQFLNRMHWNQQMADEFHQYYNVIYHDGDRHDREQHKSFG